MEPGLLKLRSAMARNGVERWKGLENHLVTEAIRRRLEKDKLGVLNFQLRVLVEIRKRLWWPPRNLLPLCFQAITAADGVPVLHYIQAYNERKTPEWQRICMALKCLPRFAYCCKEKKIPTVQTTPWMIKMSVASEGQVDIVCLQVWCPEKGRSHA